MPRHAMFFLGVPENGIYRPNGRFQLEHHHSPVRMVILFSDKPIGPIGPAHLKSSIGIHGNFLGIPWGFIWVMEMWGWCRPEMPWATRLFIDMFVDDFHAWQDSCVFAIDVFHIGTASLGVMLPLQPPLGLLQCPLLRSTLRTPHSPLSVYTPLFTLHTSRSTLILVDTPQSTMVWQGKNIQECCKRL